MFCCIRTCLDGFGLPHNTNKQVTKENPIRLDTSYMGYEVVIVKDGKRVCGSGGVLGAAPLVQSKSYFEVKIQQSGGWSIGLATRHTNLNLSLGGMDDHSWTLSHDGYIRYNKQQLYKINNDINNDNTQQQQQTSTSTSNSSISKIPSEGDIIGVSYDHIHLKFYLNGQHLDGADVNNCKGTLYPVLYVDDGSILDIIFDNFTYPIPNGYERIMIEQSLL